LSEGDDRSDRRSELARTADRAAIEAIGTSNEWMTA
jgi:hypothetical protein